MAEELDIDICRVYMPLFSYDTESYEVTPLADLAQSQMYCLMPVCRLIKNPGGDISGQETVHYLALDEIPMEQAVQKGEVGDSVSENDVPSIEPQTAEPVNNESTVEMVPHEMVNPIDISAWRNYETLVKECYTIDSNTMAGSDQLDVDKLFGKDMTLDTSGDGPQILIYHTHSQEAFADSIPGDVHTTIVGVGDRLAQILTEVYGYRVLHHTGEYDVESRDDAYSKALPALEQVLQENPSIEVVIDLHRDQMAEHTRLVTEVDGKPTARFMFFNGLSRTRKTGNIDYLYNPNLEDNLAFSFQMQLAAMEYYPGLPRKIYLKGYRYNMHLRPRNLLIELGAQNNTVEEAMNACEPLAHILHLVLSGEEKETRAE
ncbi:MAG: stage II sporulation protein P [Lachnospiraceae bacterium]|nr:stage II sporulation protein P [Lachnospiraceae bacterium]